MDACDEMHEQFYDILDDWFIESLKTYKDLYVYHLDHPTRVIEWTSEKTICVAGFGSDKNEMLELRLPPKLFADENKGLCAERDFKVLHGGFTDGPVHCLRHIPGTRCVVTNDGRSSSVQVWDVSGDESDVIRRTGSIDPGTAGERGSQVAAGLSTEPCVLHGAMLGHIQLTHLTSGKTCYSLETESSDPLSSLQFVSQNVFLACCCNGDLYIVDMRTPSCPQPAPVPPVKPVPPECRTHVTHWCMDVSTDTSCPDPANSRVARLSSGAEVVVSDLRNLSCPLYQALLGVQTDESSQGHISVSWAPALDDCIAVSGFNGAVQVFTMSTCGLDLKEQQALFEHRGHVVPTVPPGSRTPVHTTSHTWHPSCPRTLLSAATDGSVHVWDWVDQRTVQN